MKRKQMRLQRIELKIHYIVIQINEAVYDEAYQSSMDNKDESEEDTENFDEKESGVLSVFKAMVVYQTPADTAGRATNAFSTSNAHKGFIVWRWVKLLIVKEPMYEDLVLQFYANLCKEGNSLRNAINKFPNRVPLQWRHNDTTSRNAGMGENLSGNQLKHEGTRLNRIEKKLEFVVNELYIYGFEKFILRHVEDDESSKEEPDSSYEEETGQGKEKFRKSLHDNA
ncbi:hypothetical protein ACH5RR_039024 [Cinchona calisaya]|uniref:Uncharacterized protein n=1 Tax=Cinchona calisaya TaxID=153742 RepID=A0ABD2XZI5_9GENT